MDLETINQKLDSLMAATKEVLTIDEAAGYIGITKEYMYKMTSRNKVPFYKPNGKNIYFDRIELNNWLLTNRQKTTAEIEAEANKMIHLRSSKKRR